MESRTENSSNETVETKNSELIRKGKMVLFPNLTELRTLLANRRIVHCHGVFDILHAGHLAYFESAKKFGDVLVVTITADKFVNKGPGRPYFNEKIRANMLAALEIVDFVAISHFPTAVPSIEALKPDFYVKGPDYKDKTSDPTGNIYHEESTAEKNGGRLVFTDDGTFSSSSLINNFFPAWNDEQSTTIERIKSAGGLAAIENILREASKLKITIVGEPIVDTYVFCKPEAISSKSPSISARYLYQEDYTGGSLAIANHLADFVEEVKLVVTHGGEPWFENLLREKMDSRIKLHDVKLDGIPTPRKTRYIADDRVQRLFELTDIKFDQWMHHSSKVFLDLAKLCSMQSDATIIADFGHGLFEGEVLDALAGWKTFKALNVQTNSSNLGFNPYTKHRSFSYLSIDAKEARVAFQDRYSAQLDLAKRVGDHCANLNAAVAMTLGPNGAYFIGQNSREEIRAPAFADSIVDAVGAGDAFFSITSLLVKSGAPDIFVPFIGNVFAGLKTRIMGNKQSVTKAQLTKAITSILK